MANTLYDKARERFLRGQINWDTDTMKVALIDKNVYTPNFTTHEYMSDVSGSSIVAAGVTLTGKASTAGAADANDVTFTAVSGAESEALIIYKDTGDPATSPLIALIDSATGLPITPNGGDIIVVWDNGANKIFKL
jgi:hypothetical protein